MTESGGIAGDVAPGVQPGGPHEPKERGASLMWRRLRGGVALPASLALVAMQVVAMVVGRLFLPHPPGFHARSLAGHLLVWDGGNYFSIALHGYSWNPALAATHYQVIAFFPLQALIDRVMLPAGPVAAPVLILLVTLGFGIASIFAFESLARMLLPARAVAPSVLCFAFWPASSFQMMGYPTGLISLCVILALTCHLQGRFRRSGIWLGLGTAAAPTVAFAGAALGLEHALAWLRTGLRPRRFLALVLWSVLALSGVLAFMLYQQLAFHDPLAFVKAQAAWGTAPPPHVRLHRLTHTRWYLEQPRAGLREIGKGQALLHQGAVWQGARWIEGGAQRLVNFGAFLVALVGLVMASLTLRKAARVVTWAGWIVLFSYLWFIVSTNQNILQVPRLLFPAIAIFVGLGFLLARLPRWTNVVAIAVLTVVSFAEMAAAAAGLWVV